jgi:hypothetical protein
VNLFTSHIRKHRVFYARFLHFEKHDFSRKKSIKRAGKCKGDAVRAQAASEFWGLRVVIFGEKLTLQIDRLTLQREDLLLQSPASRW